MRTPLYPEVETLIKLKKQSNNEFFQQNFWYSVCRLINGNMEIGEFVQKYSYHIPHLHETWDELNDSDDIDLLVKTQGIKNYGQVSSTACETIATCYNNYYIENFENTISNYFIYKLRTSFDNLKMPEVKYIVYNHVMETLFSSCPTTITAENIVSSLNKRMKVRACLFLKSLMSQIRNILSATPLTRDVLNKAPFDILPALRYILENYESTIAKNQQSQIEVAQQEQQSVEAVVSLIQQRRRPKKKKTKQRNLSTENNNSKNELQPPKFQSPRLLSLFPNPGFEWRFIKVDGQNIAGIFGRSSPKKPEETVFNFAQRCFYDNFDLKKLKINRRVDRYFRPCTVNPNRSDVFVSYHGKNDLRRLSTADYYNMNGTVNRQKLEQDRKKRSDIEQIETHFPSPKTAKLQHYTEYVMYALQHFRALTNFYGFNAAKIKWCNYKGSQQAIENTVNILMNGAKKYNKRKRKKTKKNKRKRRGHHDNYPPNTGGMRSRYSTYSLYSSP
ncbi:uncharacterized protein B0P05DRAFT_470570 [Gilbertella persicaria]|uniref:uncharacterized protein n=1 Tax=Gilbertella persicaria TaxID=101096 RepID=UPI00221E9008|nr:uncharacterized protein B0P05DRAFT_470570 [Gilbertella persicaria]KAI8078183.1 hypothetical protein B0P05DRAFT_470570 [Gilbertella persicaria]